MNKQVSLEEEGGKQDIFMRIGGAIYWHGWGAFCVYLAVKESRWAQSWLQTLGKEEQATAGGILLAGAAVVGFLASKGLFKVIDKFICSALLNFSSKLFLAVLYGIGMFFSLATSIAPTSFKDKIASLDPALMKKKPVIASTVLEISGGARQEDLDEELLAKLEAMLVEEMRGDVESILRENGLASLGFDPQASSESAYTVFLGEKFGVIDVRIELVARYSTVFGILGNDLFRISCVRASDHEIPVWEEECGREVHNTFEFAPRGGFEAAFGMALFKVTEQREEVKWYQKAAESGNAEAQYRLGEMYADGIGTLEDDIAAARWYRESAMQGVVNAQRDLGILYSSEDGAGKNLIESYAWLSIAAYGGSSKSKMLKSYLVPDMSPWEIKKAQALSRELLQEIERPQSLSTRSSTK